VTRTLDRLVPFFTWALLLVGYQLAFAKYFPGRYGNIGHDYSNTLPAYLDGYFWFHVNGPLSVPWFTPSMCGGQPFFADPQSAYYSLPTLLVLLLDPLSASWLSLLAFASLGFWGTYALLRRVGGLSRAAALLGGGLAMFDGFLVYRVVTGENGFASIALLPWIALALLDPAAWPCGPLRRGGNVLVAGLLVAVSLQGGLTTLMIPAALSVLALGLLVVESGAALRTFTLRGLGAGALATAISASKLVAGVALMRRFPRSDYTLPGFEHVWDALRFAVWSLFGKSDDVYQASRDLLKNAEWVVWPHEWAYGFTPVAALFLVAGLLATVAIPSNRGSGPSVGRLLRVAGVVVIFALPLAFLVYTPGWNALLKSLPIVGQTSYPFRWIIIYAPAVVWGAAAGAERVLQGRPRALVVAAGLATMWFYDYADTDEFYQRQNTYDPKFLLEADRAMRAGTLEPQIIGMITRAHHPKEMNNLAPNEVFVYGASAIDCYNPVFGYRQEHYPWGPIRPGGALDEVGGVLNVKNPACYVFPDENGCAPGDHFRLDQRADAEAFLSYHPFTFAKSTVQHVADATTELALAAAAILGGWTLLRRRTPA
jgi:hypothetical protein